MELSSSSDSQTCSRFSKDRVHHSARYDSQCWNHHHFVICFHTNNSRQNLSQKYRMITTNWTNNRFNGMEIDIIHHTSVTWKTISTSQQIDSLTWFLMMWYHKHKQSHLHFHKSPLQDLDSMHIVVNCHYCLAIYHLNSLTSPYDHASASDNDFPLQSTH